MASRVALLGLALALGSADALASPEPSECQCSMDALQSRPSRSLGWPWRGSLRDGERLRESAALRYVPVDVPRGNFWGTHNLVGLIERAAAAVRARAPGARLTVGELSRAQGGNILGHSSHENGRDVDFGFYLLDEAGVPVEARSFVNVGRSGRGHLDEETVVTFDDARNWLLVEALISDPRVTVQHVFVHRTLRQRLLREAERQGVSTTLRARAERVVMSPHAAHPHRNHFHVRVFCAQDELPGCRDRGPYWPWLPTRHPYQSLILPDLIAMLQLEGAIRAADAPPSSP